MCPYSRLQTVGRNAHSIDIWGRCHFNKTPYRSHLIKCQVLSICHLQRMPHKETYTKMLEFQINTSYENILSSKAL